MKKHHAFLYFSLCFILGLGLLSFLKFDPFYLFVFSLICFTISLLAWQHKFYRILLLGALFLFLGALRLELATPQINSQHISFWSNQKLEFTGQIIAEPDARPTHTKLTLSKIQINSQPITGKILINTYKFNEFTFGNWLQVSCHLETPGIIKSTDKFSRDFDYGRYLSRTGIYAVCYRAESIEKLPFEAPLTLSHKFHQSLISLKQNFKQTINHHLPLPESALLNAMLLGYKRELPQKLTDNFSYSGVSHLIAISGLHITIIAGLIFYLLILFGLPRPRAFWPSVLILLLYVLMIGFRASAIRAFIMGAILLYALKIGRLNKSLNALILSAAILLLINPYLLIFDIGFQLSFLAVLGILYFYPLFDTWLSFIPDKMKIRPLISLTLSAQILTLPLVIYYFGVLSIISPLANLLILPLLPFVMIFGIILVTSGLIYSKLAFIFGLITYFPLKYIIKITELLPQIPFSCFELQTLPFWIILIIYILIIALYFILTKKQLSS